MSNRMVNQMHYFSSLKGLSDYDQVHVFDLSKLNERDFSEENILENQIIANLIIALIDYILD